MISSRKWLKVCENGGNAVDNTEEQEEAEAESQTDAEDKGPDDAIDWEEILLDGFDAGGRREEHEEKEYYEPVTVDTRDLSGLDTAALEARRATLATSCSAFCAPSAASVRSESARLFSRRSKTQATARSISKAAEP